MYALLHVRNMLGTGSEAKCWRGVAADVNGTRKYLFAFIFSGNTPFEVARIVQQSQIALQQSQIAIQQSQIAIQTPNPSILLPLPLPHARRGIGFGLLTGRRVRAEGGRGAGGGGGGTGAGVEAQVPSTWQTLRYVYETKSAAGLFLGIQARIGQVFLCVCVCVV